MRTLYISYLSALEPLVHTQVLPYLRALRRGGVEVTFLSFEPKPGDERVASLQAHLAGEGIDWRRLRYHKRPSLPATFLDIVVGACYALRLIRTQNIGVVHARAHVPAMMARTAKRVSGVKFLFDFRGLMAEEYADAGVWSERSFPFRLVKRWEQKLFEEADHVVVLTERMRRHLCDARLPPDKITVIPCCVDLTRFQPSFNGHRVKRAGEEAPPLLVYAGSVTGLYLLEEMADFFGALRRRRGGHFLVLTAADPEVVAAAFHERALPASAYTVRRAAPSEVPQFLASADIGISFRKPTSAQVAASPTKIGEYLACGLPVVSNTGIGDVDELLTAEEVGALVPRFDTAHYERAVDEVLRLLAEKASTQARCRGVAERCFSLQRVGGARYLAIYGLLE